MIAASSRKSLSFIVSSCNTQNVKTRAKYFLAPVTILKFDLVSVVHYFEGRDLSRDVWIKEFVKRK